MVREGRAYPTLVVEHGDPAVLIRARTRDDLLALREQLPLLELSESRNADYRWRARLLRLEWVAAAAPLADTVDYPNFKDAVANLQRSRRAELYGRIWAELQRSVGLVP